MDLPFIAAAERNKEPILAALAPAFAGVRRVLEIGAGTGQHATHFAAAMPHLVWQASERAAALDGLAPRIAAARLDNLPAPIALDAERGPWPPAAYDAAYGANLVHYMAPGVVEALFAGLGVALAASATFALYGPFRRDGRFVSAGDRELDRWLRERDPAFGVRDLETLAALGRGQGFELCEDHPLPANNCLLVWRREPEAGRRSG